MHEISAATCCTYMYMASAEQIIRIFFFMQHVAPSQLPHKPCRQVSQRAIPRKMFLRSCAPKIHTLINHFLLTQKGGDAELAQNYRLESSITKNQTKIRSTPRRSVHCSIICEQFS